MKNTRIMTFDKVSGFYPDLQGLVSPDAGFERKALQDAPPLTPIRVRGILPVSVTPVQTVMETSSFPKGSL